MQQAAVPAFDAAPYILVGFGHCARHLVRTYDTTQYILAGYQDSKTLIGKVLALHDM